MEKRNWIINAKPYNNGTGNISETFGKHSVPNFEPDSGMFQKKSFRVFQPTEITSIKGMGDVYETFAKQKISQLGYFPPHM